MTDERFAGVLQLLGAYGLLLDRLEVDAWLDLFAEPGVLDINGHQLTTRDQRRRLTERAPRGLHVTNLPVIDGDLAAGQVRATSTFLFWNLGQATALAGWYDDELVRHADRWFFVHRRISFLEG